MKEKISKLVDDSIKELDMYVDESFISDEEGKKILNIVLDSEIIIDVEIITKPIRNTPIQVY